MQGRDVRDGRRNHESAQFSDCLIGSYPTSNRAGWHLAVENETGSPGAEMVMAVCAPAVTTG